MKNYSLLLTAILVFTTACKKDKAEKQTCRISKLTTASGKEIRVNYDAEARYAKIENGQTGETNSVVYDAGSIVYSVTKTATGTLVQRITIALNSSGMASTVRRETYDASGTRTSLYNTVCEYNGTELVKTTTTVSGRSAPTVDSYSWTNGNMTLVHRANYDGVYEYYTDKPVQQGDWLSFEYLLDAGFDFSTMIKNKHLLKSQDGVSFSYGFDAEGKINTMSYGGNRVYTLEYECK